MDIWGVIAFVGTILFAVYDWQFTVERMRKYGQVVELNRWVTFGSTMLGSTGVLLATLLPTLLLLTLATVTGSRMGLGFLLGARALLFRFQRISKRLENALDESLKN